MPPPVPLPASPSPSDLVLFVSSVEGKPFTRLALPGRPYSRELIGAVREKGVTKYSPALVVGLTRAEVEAHRKVYERALRPGGELRRRTEDEWRAQQAAHAKAKAEAKAKADKAAQAAKGAPRGATAPAAPAGGDRS